MAKGRRKPIKRRLPQQIHVCDTCGYRFKKWSDEVYATANFAQIVCATCKDDIEARIQAHSAFAKWEKKGHFRRVKLSHMQFK